MTAQPHLPPASDTPLERAARAARAPAQVAPRPWTWLRAAARSLRRWVPSALIVLAAWWAVQAWHTRDLAERLPLDWPLSWIDAQGGVHKQTVAQGSGPADAVRRHLQRRGLNWPVVVDPEGALARRLGLAAVPAWVVIDRQGRVWAPSVGYTPGWALRARLQWARLRAAWGGP